MRPIEKIDFSYKVRAYIMSSIMERSFTAKVRRVSFAFPGHPVALQSRPSGTPGTTERIGVCDDRRVR